jgi:hypothetical protein
VPAPRPSPLAADLAAAAESAARLRVLLDVLRERVEALEAPPAPVGPGRVASRRLAALKAHEGRAAARS